MMCAISKAKVVTLYRPFKFSKHEYVASKSMTLLNSVNQRMSIYFLLRGIMQFYYFNSCTRDKPPLIPFSTSNQESRADVGISISSFSDGLGTHFGLRAIVLLRRRRAPLTLGLNLAIQDQEKANGEY